MESPVRSWLILCSLAAFATSPAAADFTRVVLPNGFKVSLDSAYRNNDQIRVRGSAVSSVFPSEVMRAALVRMAELTHAKGKPRFAVVKISDCGRLLMNGSPVSSDCRLVGQMLGEGESARPEGKREINYFRVADIMGGRLAPESGLATAF